MKNSLNRESLRQELSEFEANRQGAEPSMVYTQSLLKEMRLNKELDDRVALTVARIEKSGTTKQKDRLFDLQLETRIFLSTIFQAAGLRHCSLEEQKRVLTRKLLEGYPRMAQSVAVSEARSFCLNRILS